MKQIIVMVSCLFIGVLSDRVVAFYKPEVYYFCTSSPFRSKEAAVGKSYVWFTGIKKMPIRQDELIKSLTKEWAAKINRQCRNSNGCSSNLNVYDSEAAAMYELEGFKKRFADTSLYQMAEMAFQ
jgi:hypothetical protein